MKQEISILDFKIENEDQKFKFLYKPNDDSYLMLYTVCKDLLSELQNNNDILNICEVGIGSGFVIHNILNFLKQNDQKNLNYFGIDINIDACQFTKNYTQKYQNQIEIINTNIFQGLKGLKEQLDIVILNPVNQKALCTYTTFRIT